MQPGSCESKYPYYLTGDSLPAPNSTLTAQLCTTDSLSSDKNAVKCCQEELDIDIHNCSDKYTVYKLKKKMNKDACGYVCLSSQNKEGILPVATLSIAIYVSSKARSRRDVARGVKCCRRRCQPQLIASTSKSHRASNALQQDKISIL